MCACFCMDILSAHLDKYLGAQLLDCMVRLCLACNKLLNYLPKWLYHFTFPQVVNKSSCCSTSLPTFGVVSVLNVSHSNRYVVVSHCCFNLHFPNDIWYGASFHMLIFHLHILFGEVSLQIFCLLFNWVVCFLIVEF